MLSRYEQDGLKGKLNDFADLVTEGLEQIWYSSITECGITWISFCEGLHVFHGCFSLDNGETYFFVNGVLMDSLAISSSMIYISFS